MNIRKKTVGLLFGGRSTEHEVSITSAFSVLKQIDLTKYEILPIRISRSGVWELLPDNYQPGSPHGLIHQKGQPVLMNPASHGIIPVNDSRSTSDKGAREIDVIFPLLHGTYGEDGTLQGLVSMADIPCVGAGVMASSVGMDKVVMKQLFFQNDLKSPDFIWFLRSDWESSREKIIRGVSGEIEYPCFVKSANTGSSVGVFKAFNESELGKCIDSAAQFDRKLLVEKAINARELECGVLGNDRVESTVVGEIVPKRDFYDYQAKYLSEDSEIIIPADIPRETGRLVQQMAEAAFKSLDCAGMGRIDFLLERETETLYVNEINTIPGFTPISMYPKLWEASGVAYPGLIDRLINLALERFQDLKRSKINNNGNVITFDKDSQ